MSEQQTDYKQLSVFLTRAIYFVSNLFLIHFLFDKEDGSLLFPTDEFGVTDALISSLILVLVSFFSIRFALNNNRNNTNDVVILISSVALGAILIS